MADQSFRVIITAVDRATAVMRTINRNVGGLARPFTDVSRAAGNFLEAAGFEKIAKSAESAWGKVEHLGHSVLALAGPLAALGAAASAGGLIEIAKSASEYGDKLYLAAQKTGVQTSALARLHYVAQTTEVDAAQLDKALFRLNKTLAESAAGKNKDAAAMFAALHIPLRDGNGQVRIAAAVWGDLAEAVKKNPDAAIQARIAATAFGARVGGDLIPALLLGRKRTAELGEEFDRLHGKFGDEDAKRAHEAAEGWRRLGLAAQGVKDAIGVAMIPALQRVIEPMTAWLSANRQLVATRVADFVGKVGEAVKQIDWRGIALAVQTAGKAFGQLFTYLGPVRFAMLGIGVVMAPMILAFGKLGLAIATTAARLALFALAPVVAAFGNFVTALRAGYGAMAAFNLVLAANPIGMVIVGIAAVAGAAFLIYKNWTPISAFFKTVWAAMTSAVSVGVKSIGSLIAWLWDHSPLKALVDTLKWVLNLPGVQTAVAALGKGWNTATKAMGEYSAGVKAVQSAAPKTPPRTIVAMNALGQGMRNAAAAVAIATAPVAAAAAPAPQTIVTPDGQVIQAPAPMIRAPAPAVVPGPVIKQAAPVIRSAPSVTVPASVVVTPRVMPTPVKVPQAIVQSAAASQPAAPAAIARSAPVSSPSASQPLIQRSTAAGSSGPTNGKVDVSIDFNNVPRGTKVTAKATGTNPPPLEVGTRFEPGL